MQLAVAALEVAEASGAVRMWPHIVCVFVCVCDCRVCNDHCALDSYFVSVHSGSRVADYLCACMQHCVLVADCLCVFVCVFTHTVLPELTFDGTSCRAWMVPWAQCPGAAFADMMLWDCSC